MTIIIAVFNFLRQYRYSGSRKRCRSWCGFRTKCTGRLWTRKLSTSSTISTFMKSTTPTAESNYPEWSCRSLLPENGYRSVLDANLRHRGIFMRTTWNVFTVISFFFLYLRYNLSTPDHKMWLVKLLSKIFISRLGQTNVYSNRFKNINGYRPRALFK